MSVNKTKQKGGKVVEVADDWDADSGSEGEAGQVQTSEKSSESVKVDGAAPGSLAAQQLPIGSLNLGDDDWPQIGQSASGRKVMMDDKSREIWQNANTEAAPKHGVILMRPQDAPVGGRTLPAGILGRESGISEGGVPKILRRASPAVAPKSSSSPGGSQTQMTLEEREKAYAEARARIFGTSSTTNEGSNSPSPRISPSPSSQSSGREGKQSRSGQRSNRGAGGRGGGGGRGNAASNSNEFNRNASRSGSGSSSPAPSPAGSRAASVLGTSDVEERQRGADRQRQPQGPQEGVAGFARR